MMCPWRRLVAMCRRGGGRAAVVCVASRGGGVWCVISRRVWHVVGYGRTCGSAGVQHGGHRVLLPRQVPVMGTSAVPAALPFMP